MDYFSVKSKITTVVISSILFPYIALAQQVDNKICSAEGYTIETINGVFTDMDGAISNRKALEHYFGKTYKGEKLTIDYLLNPSHKAMDLTDVAIQKTFEGVDMRDHDFLKILNDASTQVKTQKVLLVAHSQGNFYANNLYKAVTDDGDISKKSIGVYSVATPASHVAGEGRHLTSSTDTVIAWLAKYLLPGTIAPTNDSIDYQWSDDLGMGHDFAKIYLHYRPVTVVEDIKWSLDKLSIDPARSEDIPCINPPKELSPYEKITGAIVYPVDLTLAMASIGLTITKNAIIAVVNTAVSVGTSVVNAVKEAGNSLLALVYSASAPPPSTFLASPLSLIPAQTPPSSVASAIPAAQGAPSVVTPAPQIATETITAPSTQAVASEIISTSPAEVMPVVATSTEPVAVVETATTTPEVVVITAAGGGGWVSGVSPADPPVQDIATSTADIVIATSTEDTATSTTELIVATAPEPEITYADPVVINEIAWMGTRAQPNDEWIELYNKTGHDIDLTGWTLESRTKALAISLQGTIKARGYFFLERTASTTTNRIEDMMYTGALNNSGPDANLYLKQGTTTIDAVNFGNWPFGDNGQKRTMERVSPYATSTLYYNWKTYSESFMAPFAKDAEGNDILGTPGAQNSVAGFYTPTGDIIENAIWYSAHSPYYVPAPITVREGAPLTIEPGVTVKFAPGTPYGGALNVRGVLDAQGAAAKPIIFTSFRDDAADGVDSNQDGSTSTPASADWMNINFYATTTPSVMRHAEVKYGGQGTNYNPNGWYPSYTGAVGIYGARPEITDTVFEANHAIALYLKDAAYPILRNNSIRNTVVPTHNGAGPGGFGIRLADASATADIVGNTFENNTIAISSDSASDMPLVVRDNIFLNNQKNGEFNGYANFNLDNSGNRDANSKGGFSIQVFVSNGQSKTVKADSMPYIIGSLFEVSSGGALTVEPGAIFKFARPNPNSSIAPAVMRGTLTARGTASAPIVFTGIADDSDGYDSNYADRQPIPGDWENIQFIGASSSDSILEYVHIRYGGQGNNLCPYAYFGGPCMEYKGAVLVDGASPTFTHMTFDHNLAVSIYLDGATQSTIQNSSLLNTIPGTTGPHNDAVAGYGISIGAESLPTLTDNAYSGNVEDVVYR